jgi:hypothetical protein
MKNETRARTFRRHVIFPFRKAVCKYTFYLSAPNEIDEISRRLMKLKKRVQRGKYMPERWTEEVTTEGVPGSILELFLEFRKPYNGRPSGVFEFQTILLRSVAALFDCYYSQLDVVLPNGCWATDDIIWRDNVLVDPKYSKLVERRDFSPPSDIRSYGIFLE